MTWVPSCRVDISPLKMQVDIDYLLRIMGMVISSVSKYQSDNKVAGNINAAGKANEPLHYVTRGQLNLLMTYIEKLHISPVYFDFELNIKSDDQVGSDAEFDSNLTLHSIAQSTDSGKSIKAALRFWSGVPTDPTLCSSRPFWHLELGDRCRIELCPRLSPFRI